uniref:Transposase, YhgA-like n=1 Tax=Candidatus Kentrum sp. FW TaxID=2126338 RepID=A0A450U3W4_9GAMM|nr:MAG: Putative transposase, YhgA-like [Candidatus Kentron sp. FW]
MQAGILLWERLPKKVVEHFSDEPPELMPDSFVEERLRGHFSDRLFKVKTEGHPERHGGPLARLRLRPMNHDPAPVKEPLKPDLFVKPSGK